MASDLIKHTSDSSFQTDVLDSSREKPVLVDFWATWCGPCRAIAPHLEAIAAELGDKVSIVKLDVDQNQATALQFGVVNIPTLLLFKGGEVVHKQVGNPGTRAKLKAILDPHV